MEGVPAEFLGDQRDPSWGDMSKYVVHFTNEPRVFAEILGTGVLRASGPYGFSWVRNVPEVSGHHMSACLSEVPLDKVGRLMRRHGRFGIGFTKDFIRSEQGARVWYLDQGSSPVQSMNVHLQGLASVRDFGHPVWTLTPFIDLVIPNKYEWDWEREWRVQGGFQFLPRDVAFIITPDGFSEFSGPYRAHLPPDHESPAMEAEQPLLETLEDQIQEFFRSFEDPVNCLPVDGGEYIWLVDEWSTEEAVAEVFQDLPANEYDLLVQELNDIGWSWVLSADLASLYGDD